MTTATQTKTYTARVVRFGDWWAIDVPEVKGVHTQTRRLEDAAAMAQDAIAVALDVAPEAVDVSVTTELDAETRTLVEEAHQAREEAQRAQTRASNAINTTVRHLGVRGVSVRDAGHLLGLSYQRISQIRNSARQQLARATKRKSSERKGRKGHRTA